MSFNVRPWVRQWHNFWLSKPFRLDIAGLDSVAIQQFGSIPHWVYWSLDEKLIFRKSRCISAIHKLLAIALRTFCILFFTSIQNSVYRHIPSPLFPGPRAVSLMRQYRNRFYSNADHTRRIREGRDVTKSDACVHKAHRTHTVCI